MKGKLCKFRVTYRVIDALRTGWYIAIEGLHTGTAWGVKAAAVREARRQAKAFGGAAAAARRPGYRGASLTVHGRTGRRILEERTYPRAADPRRSPG